MTRCSVGLMLIGFAVIACGRQTESENTDAESDAQVGDRSATEVSDAFGGDWDAGVDPYTDTHIGEESFDTWKYPDPSFVHKRTAKEPYVSASEAYWMDEPKQYRSSERLPVLDVTSVAAAGGTVWAGTAKGLFRLNQEEDRFEKVEGIEGPVLDMSERTDDQNRVLVLSDKLYFVESDGTVAKEVAVTSGVKSTCVTVGDGAVYLGTSAGVAELNGDGWQPVPGMEGALEVRDVLTDSAGRLWAATPNGVVVVDGDSVTEYSADDGALADDDTRALVEYKGFVFVGSLTGVSAPEAGLILRGGVGGLPYDHVVAMDSDDKRLYLAHDIGATAVELDDALNLLEVDHYVGRRWLPSDDVRDIASMGPNTYFIATASGITEIQWQKKTLAQKAAYHEKLLDDHFWRMDGFVAADAFIDDAWNPTKWTVADKDNDGLWTQMQIGAWCYAYAVTKDETYYQKARRAMDVMFLEVDVPAIDFEKAGLGRGFVTRSLVRDDEEKLFESKATQPNWHLVEYQGHKYYWKDDTSSDETTGHFFGYPLFYDLCAKTDQERAEVAEHAAAIASYIIDHGFKLIDLDGEPTTHGHWEPQRLAAALDGLEACLEKAQQAEDPIQYAGWCIGSWYGEGWLNSTEILGHLLAAWHMSGDTRFYDAYQELITKYHYDKLVVPTDHTATITDPVFMNHSDHELAFLAYHTLIRYEPSQERRKRWIQGMLFLYEHEKVEHNPLWTAFVAMLAGDEHADVLPAIQSLREMPQDRRELFIDNSHRMDADDWPDDRSQDPQFDRVFPYDEIRTVWWNGNLHVKKWGGDGRGVSGPMAFLLPYWAMRYAGLIGE